MAILAAVRPIVGSISQIPQPASSAERWANYVLLACKSERDPRTLGIWAHQIAVSYTTLCESCRLIGIQPRQARDFTRILRLLMQPFFEPRELASFLDISDRRTLDSILRNAGFMPHAIVSRQMSVAYFLDNQRFIADKNAGLTIIRNILVTP